MQGTKYILYVFIYKNLTAQSHLAHLTLAVSREERHVINLIHHHKVLLFTLKVLQKFQKSHTTIR